jgi:small subunit ribosomal protein S16
VTATLLDDLKFGLRSGGKVLLAIKLMRTGAKKRPSYRVVVKEKQSKRDGAYLENVGTYNPTREPAEIKLDMDRVRYWIGKGAQPTDTVGRLIKASDKQQAEAASSSEA